MAKKRTTKKHAGVLFWGVYKQASEGLKVIYSIGRTRDEAMNEAVHELGERPLVAAGWSYVPSSRTPKRKRPLRRRVRRR
jgi:hypothetical protein